MGAFTVKDWRWRVDPVELAAEIAEQHSQSLGNLGAVRTCMESLKTYTEDPTAANIEQLRQAYEAVPKHLRMYCGDMDSKDVPIRMILYGKDEIKQWSHYQVAESEGMTLPTIEIPPSPES